MHTFVSARTFRLILAVLSLGSLWSAEPASARTDLDAALAKGHELVANRRFEAARTSYQAVLEHPNASAVFKCLAQLAQAKTFSLETNFSAARREYAKVAAISQAPAHLVWEANERLKEMDRLEAGLSARDPAGSRTKLGKLPAPGLILHVAVDGRDSNSGTEQSPFATLERARDEIRNLRKSTQLPSGPITVLVHEGEYRLAQTFNLEISDSGTETAPIVYRAVAPGKTRFRGGIRLQNFTPVNDPALQQLLPESARTHILQADLKKEGMREILPVRLGGFASGHGFKTHPAHELFVNGKALQLARGPNEGFLRIKEVVVKDGTKGYDRSGSKIGQFIAANEIPKKWGEEPELLLYGYWFWDWADSYERVLSIDPEQRRVHLAEPYHNYGYSIGAPFYAINALSELDLPGEWYLDRRTQTLLVYPPSDLNKANVELSTFPGTMLQMDSVSHVRLENIVWELGSADAIHINGGSNVVLAGCTVRHFAGNGIEIRGGFNHGLLSCDIYSMGRGGTVITGGDRKTLAPGGHFIENCEVHDLSRIDHTYTPAVILSGVGNRIGHNRFYNILSSAMRVGGNDHSIEFNEIFDVVLESDDQGGADMYGNATYRGNVFRFNHWHHIGKWDAAADQPKCGQAGIRLDDAISGTLVYGNIFERCAAGKIGFGGVQIHGGKDNIIDNNLFVDCSAAISVTAWTADRWREFAATALDPQIDASLYLARYPELARLAVHANENHIWRNRMLRVGDFLRRAPNSLHLAGNFPNDTSNTPFTGKLDAVGFAAIPFSEIGLYQDEFRTRVEPGPSQSSRR